MSNRDLIRLAPQELIDSALRIDAEVLSDSDRFCKENASIYDLAINTWLIAWHDYAPYTWVAIATKIRSCGLAGSVKYFKDAADSLLTAGDLTDYPLAKSAYSEIVNRMGTVFVPHWDYESSNSPDGIFLFLCRYLKRLTPLLANRLSVEAISSFKQNQNRLKLISRKGYSPFLIQLCRDEVNASAIAKRTRLFSQIIMADIELTPGVCYTLGGEKLSTQAEKEAALIRDYQYNTSDVQRRSVWQFNMGDKAWLTTVPKTLSAARTIAPEQELRQSVAHRMFTLAADTLPAEIDLSNQGLNQTLAKEGSVTGEWCTIDLSHASDDVTWLLVQEIFFDYPEYLRYLGNIRPKYVYIDTGRTPALLQSFATMGNSYTFINETEVFWIITKAAIHFAQRMGVVCSDHICVYGDDIVCASAAYPYVIAFLEKLGFVPNLSKSFSEGRFRESCGKDYLRGEDVSSPYFPRRPLKSLLSTVRSQNGDLITTAESLISLQHRLLNVSPQAAQYVELALREQRPDLGYAVAGTSDTDLWGYDVHYACVRYIPEGVWETKSTETRFHLGKFGSATLVSESKKLKRAIVKDEIHAVNCQIRPVTTVGRENRNDELVYLEYLRKGPYYQSDLDRVLGISSSRKLIPTGKPLSEWRKVEA